MRIKEYLHSMLQNALYDIFKTGIIAIFTIGIVFPASFSFLTVLQIPFWCIILFSIGIVALVFFIVLLIYQKISYKYAAPVKLDCDYTILNKEVEFRYDGKVSYYESKIKIEINKKTRNYYGKYYWSGSGTAKIKVTNPNYQLNILKRRTRYIEYEVVFDKVYKKGKKVDFKLQGEMNDPQRTFSPYISTSIDVPTKKLRITLKIDQDKYPISGLEKEAVIPHRNDHENAEPINLTDDEYEWQVNKPQVGYQYCLTWNFK